MILPLYLQSVHNREFERNLLHMHTAGSYCCQNVHHKQPQQVIDFRLFLRALYLSWHNILISEVTSIHVNNTTKNTQPTSVCAFSWHADSRKRNTSTVAWFWASNTVWMRSALFWDFTQRRLVVSCRRFETTVGGGEILTAVLLKIQVIWAVDWSFYLHLQGQQPRIHYVPPKRP